MPYYFDDFGDRIWCSEETLETRKKQLDPSLLNHYWGGSVSKTKPFQHITDKLKTKEHKERMIDDLCKYFL